MPASDAARTTSRSSASRGKIHGNEWTCRSTAPWTLMSSMRLPRCGFGEFELALTQGGDLLFDRLQRGEVAGYHRDVVNDLERRERVHGVEVGAGEEQRLTGHSCSEP